MGTTWADIRPQVRTERASTIRQQKDSVIEFSFSGERGALAQCKSNDQRSRSTAASGKGQWMEPRDSLKVASRLDRGRKYQESRALRSDATMKSRGASPLADIAKRPGAEYTSPERGTVCASLCRQPYSSLPWFCAVGCWLTDVATSCWSWAGAFACRLCLETVVLTFWPTN